MRPRLTAGLPLSQRRPLRCACNERIDTTLQRQGICQAAHSRNVSGNHSDNSAFCWMRKGKQRPLKTPGTNRKVWISGAHNFRTGAFHWVRGEHKNDELFIELLDRLRRIYRCHKELHLAMDNDSSHTSKRVERYVEGPGGRICLHPLPSWSPESNPVELVWWSLHEAVRRNHECSGLDELVEFAEHYL